ncbi:MAG TPA: peptidoglycan -binding protein [Roseiarcus sp.]|nr:peptidoglycan -binding protein [Roseiarcus sp.]
MALSRGRRRAPVNYWPGFVDALSTMLLIIIFLLSVFMLSQFFLSREVTGKDSALEKLNRQIEELTSLLAMERSQSGVDQNKIMALTATLDQARKDKNELETAAATGGEGALAQGHRADAALSAFDAQKAITAKALAQVEVLNQQISALRQQLAAIQDALNISKTSQKQAQEKISDLGQRLNLALAQKVQELARYRSDFFGRLRQILGNRPDITIVGDRFVFQSSVLFDPGKADLSQAGKASLDQLAGAALDLEREIPPDIPWVLRIDGHTDAEPVAPGGPFKSNWDLSTARAVSVVQYLISKGVDPHYLAAAGFGQYQPLDPGKSEEAYARNRRIELKLTER